MQPCFKIPICLCQKHSSKSASLYEGNCFLLTDDLSLVVSFPTHQSSQSDLLQLVHFWVALWHIKTLFGIHTVLLYCLQACSKLFMDIARDRTHELLFFFFKSQSYFLSGGKILCENCLGWQVMSSAFMWQVLRYQYHPLFITLNLFGKWLLTT